VLIDNVPGAMEAFEGLKRVGVQLALDDFGMAQGFLLAAPMGADDIVDCLQAEAR
jgi:EAL domain-containing protein (putative c-di-GMP-specific phosphodiesterase class I)